MDFFSELLHVSAFREQEHLRFGGGQDWRRGGGCCFRWLGDVRVCWRVVLEVTSDLVDARVVGHEGLGFLVNLRVFLVVSEFKVCWSVHVSAQLHETSQLDVRILVLVQFPE